MTAEISPAKPNAGQEEVTLGIVGLGEVRPGLGQTAFLPDEWPPGYATASLRLGNIPSFTESICKFMKAVSKKRKKRRIAHVMTLLH